MAGFLRKLFKHHDRTPSKKRKPMHNSSSASPLETVVSRRSMTRARQQRHLPRTLPAEIILHIFTLAVEDSHGGRTALQQIAVLSRACLPWARARLYTCPTVYSVKSANCLVRTLRRNTTLAHGILALRLDGWDRPESNSETHSTRKAITGRLSQLLELCPNVTHLQIRGAVMFSLTDFSGGLNIRQLTLVSTVISDRTSTSRYHPFFTILPSLTHLELVSAQFDGPTAAHFLCPTTLPRINSLHLDRLTLVDEPGTMRHLGEYEPILLARQLKTVIMGSATPVSSIAAQLPTLTALENLTLPLRVIADATDIVSLLPPGLQRLAIHEQHGQESDLLPAHVRAAGALAEACLQLISATPSLSMPSTPGPSHGLSMSTSMSPSSSWTTRSPLVRASSFSASSPPDAPAALSTAAPHTLPLFDLRVLVLPKSWSTATCPGHGAGTGEMTWALNRVERTMAARGAQVLYQDITTAVI